jgi:hypothetical protein
MSISTEYTILVSQHLSPLYSPSPLLLTPPPPPPSSAAHSSFSLLTPFSLLLHPSLSVPFSLLPHRQRPQIIFAADGVTPRAMVVGVRTAYYALRMHYSHALLTRTTRTAYSHCLLVRTTHTAYSYCLLVLTTRTRLPRARSMSTTREIFPWSAPSYSPLTTEECHGLGANGREADSQLLGPSTLASVAHSQLATAVRCTHTPLDHPPLHRRPQTQTQTQTPRAFTNGAFRPGC